VFKVESPAAELGRYADELAQVVLMKRAMILAVLVASACERAPDAGSPSDQYEIYATVLEAFVPTDTALLRIASQTNASPLVGRVGDTSELYLGIQRDTGVGPELLRSYDRANVKSIQLCNCFPKRLRVQLVPYTPRAGVAGPVELSNIAFNSDRSRALVEVSQICGRLCSSTNLYLVVRRLNGWQVARPVLTGAS
jgi:hypothetical protein